MHPKTPNVFKLVALFGLLAVTQAFPTLPPPRVPKPDPKGPGAGTPGAGTPGAGTPGAGTPGAGTPGPPGGLCARGSSISGEYDVVDSRGHIQRRCFGKKPGVQQDVPLEPVRPSRRPDKGKGKAKASGSGKTQEQRGAKYLKEFKTQFAPGAPPTHKNWKKYDKQIAANFEQGWDPNNGVFLVAVKAGRGSNKIPVFQGVAKPGALEVPAMYRSGRESVSQYGDVALEDRPHISNYINRPWTEMGNGRPLTSFSVTSKKTDAHVEQINQWTGGRSPYTIDENDPRWPTVLGSPIGSPISRAVLDDSARFQKHRPASVTFTRGSDSLGQGMWSSHYTLLPGPPP